MEACERIIVLLIMEFPLLLLTSCRTSSMIYVMKMLIL